MKFSIHNVFAVDIVDVMVLNKSVYSPACGFIYSGCYLPGIVNLDYNRLGCCEAHHNDSAYTYAYCCGNNAGSAGMFLSLCVKGLHTCLKDFPEFAGKFPKPLYGSFKKMLKLSIGFVYHKPSFPVSLLVLPFY